MTTYTYPNGTGESLGERLATCRPLISSEVIWYVNSDGGVDAASPAGQMREAPLATLGQALTNATAGDIIVLMDGHEETIASVLSFKAGIIVIGAGKSGAEPTAQLKTAGAGQLDMSSVEGCQIRNVKFPQATATNALQILSIGSYSSVLDCYFEAGQYDGTYKAQILNGSLGVLFERCTMVAVGEEGSTIPSGLVHCVGTSSDVTLRDVVIDGGVTGFSFYAVDLLGTNTRLVIEGLSLLRGSDLRVGSASTGWINPQTVTGGSRIVW